MTPSDLVKHMAKQLTLTPEEQKTLAVLTTIVDRAEATPKSQCKKCCSPLRGGFCVDEPCPYHDWKQDVPHAHLTNKVVADVMAAWPGARREYGYTCTASATAAVRSTIYVRAVDKPAAQAIAKRLAENGDAEWIYDGVLDGTVEITGCERTES